MITIFALEIKQARESKNSFKKSETLEHKDSRLKFWQLKLKTLTSKWQQVENKIFHVPSISNVFQPEHKHEYYLAEPAMWSVALKNWNTSASY